MKTKRTVATLAASILSVGALLIAPTTAMAHDRNNNNNNDREDRDRRTSRVNYVAPDGSTPNNRADNAVVTLRANAQSGITGTLRIDGYRVRGNARGFSVEDRYVTLYYGDQSSARPGATNVCADVRTATLTNRWNTRPEWRVREDGTGRLVARASRLISQRPLTFTASIRRIDRPEALDFADPYKGFTPVTYPVVACGAVNPRG